MFMGWRLNEARSIISQTQRNLMTLLRTRPELEQFLLLPLRDLTSYCKEHRLFYDDGGQNASIIQGLCYTYARGAPDVEELDQEWGVPESQVQDHVSTSMTVDSSS